jgi:Zn-dependent protease
MPEGAASDIAAYAPELVQECSGCKRALSPGDRACGHCHALVHAATLDQLAASARLHEERGEITEAREVWLRALELLPPDSTQAQWIRGHSQSLQAPSTDASTIRYSWAKRLGPLAPLAILLAKGQFLLALIKLKSLLSLGSFVAFYWALYGLKFGVGFAILILVHELGHFIDIKRRGLPADMPVFLPGLGAYVRWDALGVSAETRAFVSLAGPLAGCLAAAVCALVWTRTGDAFWLGLASLSAMLNLLNLIPVWVLDGGRAIGALDKTERILLSAAAIACAAYFAQPLFLLVAAGAAYRVFTKDIPGSPSRHATAYYIALLMALGYLIGLRPPPSFGGPG